MESLKLSREEILEHINKIIKEDYDDTYYPYEPLSEEDLLTDSLMDSFSYTMFWLNISVKYSIVPKDDGLSDKEKEKMAIDYVNWIDYKVYTVKDLIDRIEKCM